MNIAVIGEENQLVRDLKTNFQFENIDSNKIGNMEKFKLVLFNPLNLREIPDICPPKDTLLFTLFDVNKPNLEYHEHFAKKNEQANNFIVCFPGMLTEYLVEYFQSILEGNSLTSKLYDENIFFDIGFLSDLSEKRHWLQNFEMSLKKKFFAGNPDFIRMLTSIVDEMIIAAYLDRYASNNYEADYQNLVGKIIIRWGISEDQIIIKITDFSGNFYPIDFLKKRLNQINLKDIDSKMDSNLGFHTTINFCDHIEINNFAQTSTVTKLFINLNRNLFQKKRRFRNSSLVILNSDPDQENSIDQKQV